MNRRDAIRAGAAALALAACRDQGLTDPQFDRGKLRARPRPPTTTRPAGESPLELGTGRDGLVYVPQGVAPARGWPLVLLLHGSGGGRDDWRFLYEDADELGIVLLMPESRFGSWDRIDYSADVEFINRALVRTFSGTLIDGARIGIAGFSAGGAYALTLGLANGFLFSRVSAFAPAGLDVLAREGRPPVYIAHGTTDTSVPVTRSRDEIVPALRSRGLAVVFEEFAGGHVIPHGLVRGVLERV